jgi:hypothetical protein
VPTYKNVPILKDLELIKVNLDAAKNKGTYVGKEALWDKQVKDALTTHCGQAERYVAQSDAYTKRMYEEAKVFIDQIETLVKLPELQERDLQAIGRFKGRVEQNCRNAAEDTASLVEALVNEYRNKWPEKARELLHNKAILPPFENNRRAQIDAGKAFAAMRLRLKEWVKRAEEYHKQATQRLNNGEVEADKFLAEVEQFVAKMQETSTKIGDGIYSVKTAFEYFEGAVSKKKTFTAPDKTDAKIRYVSLPTGMKNVRGLFKTMTVLRDGLKKRAKMAGGRAQKKGLAAVKRADKVYSEAEKALAKATEKEKKATVLYQKIMASR